MPIEDQTASLAHLLRFDSNLHAPIHRWFKFKESFSSELVAYLLRNYFTVSRRSISFLDPFCGVGTSLLAAEQTFSELGVTSLRLRGIEVNPYIHFVATTKLDWRLYDPAALRRQATVATNGLVLEVRPPVPKLSTLRNAKFISKHDLRELLQLRDKIRLVSRRRVEQRPLLLGLAAGAEKVLNLRKDGRALRFVPRDTIQSPKNAVLSAWDEISEDLQRPVNSPPSDYLIVKADGRRADRVFGRKQFDVILFSPPYPNNIDYTEVYKIELWLLGFVKSAKQMVSQRQRTFRSHPSCLFPDYADAGTAEVLAILGEPFRRLLAYASEVPRCRSRVFAEYFADMLRTLRACARLLRDSGRIFIVLGNSLHGTPEYPIPVAADLWTCKLAHAAGLHVDRVLVGRRFIRRRFDNPLMRESVLILSKA